MTGTDLIADERRRQVAQEGWTPEHDAEHDDRELARAALCYVQSYLNPPDGQPPADWPWDAESWKPTASLHDLVRAGALIAAELDRCFGTNPSDPS